MYERLDRFFGPYIEGVQAEHQAWLELHAALEKLLEERGQPDDGSTPVSVRYHFDLPNNWTIYFTDYSGTDYGENKLNRWGQELTLPIEIELYCSDDGQGYERSITDDPKLSITCSPRGVIDNFTGAQLPINEVQDLYHDILEM